MPSQVERALSPHQTAPVAMEVDVDQKTRSPTASTAKPSAPSKKENSSAPPSTVPSPKPARASKEAPHPFPQGSGLITNALFGIDDSSTSSRSAPNIVLHIPLNGTGNKIINFARLAEEKYGFAALHPRLAAQRERLARIAAASAALEKNEKGAKGLSAGESADEDLSVDVDRDSDLDGDISMGGMGSGAATNGTLPAAAADGKKKRRKKMEDYDRDDPFVDDSELAWQEHAAASKDGFFVYSGPLVPEGDKVQVERADGTVKRGRGRGRGTGRARTSANHQHVPITAAIPISQDTGLPVRGPGSRGGVVRKSRANKAMRVHMEQDKDRERVGMTASEGSGRGRGGNHSRGSGTGARGGGGIAPNHKPALAPAPPSGNHIPGAGIMLK